MRRAGSARLFRPDRRAPDTGHRAPGAGPGGDRRPDPRRRRAMLATSSRRSTIARPVRRSRRSGRSSSPPGAAAGPRSGPWPRSSTAQLDLLVGYAARMAGRRSRRGRPVGDDGPASSTAEDARLERWPSSCTGPTPARVLVTRAADQAGDLLSALRAAGLDPVPVPAIAIEFGAARRRPRRRGRATSGTRTAGWCSRARTARGRSSRPPSGCS